MKIMDNISPETKQALVDLWLSSECNEAKRIKAAFEIGLAEGRVAADEPVDTDQAFFRWHENMPSVSRPYGTCFIVERNEVTREAAERIFTAGFKAARGEKAA